MSEELHLLKQIQRSSGSSGNDGTEGDSSPNPPVETFKRNFSARRNFERKLPEENEDDFFETMDELKVIPAKVSWSSIVS